jgi:hypothetical protein
MLSFEVIWVIKSVPHEDGRERTNYIMCGRMHAYTIIAVIGTVKARGRHGAGGRGMRLFAAFASAG